MIKILAFLVLVALILMFARWVMNRPSKPPKSDREYVAALRNNEKNYLEIVNNSNDIFAVGKASAALDQTRADLDRVLSRR